MLTRNRSKEILAHLESTINRLEYINTIQIPEMEARYTAKILELQVDLKDQINSRHHWKSMSKKLEDEVATLRGKVGANLVCPSIPPPAPLLRSNISAPETPLQFPEGYASFENYKQDRLSNARGKD